MAVGYVCYSIVEKNIIQYAVLSSVISRISMDVFMLVTPFYGSVADTMSATDLGRGG